MSNTDEHHEPIALMLKRKLEESGGHENAPKVTRHKPLSFPSVRLDEEGRLKCPFCGSEDTHMDAVQISARKEDKDSNEITVDAISGQVRTHNVDAAPFGEQVGKGRRQRISVSGYCEDGHFFAIVFTQHKGVTFVETVKQADKSEEWREAWSSENTRPTTTVTVVESNSGVPIVRQGEQCDSLMVKEEVEEEVEELRLKMLTLPTVDY